MTFEAGPWHCFGGELLERLVAIAQQQCSSAAPAQQQQPPVSISRNSLSGSAPPDNNKKTTTFIPDFSAVVRDDCTYLEITAQTYLLAYKSTLISKGSRSRDQIPRNYLQTFFIVSGRIHWRECAIENLLFSSHRYWCHNKVAMLKWS